MRISSPSRVLHWARHLQVENKGLKLLSVVLAALLFAVARQPTSDVRLSGVRIEFSGLKPGIELSGDVAKTVSLRLSGPRDLVRGLLATQIAVPADLSQKEEGERVIQLRPDDVSVPDKVKVLQIEPSSIKVLLEPTRRKIVRVEPQLTGAVTDGREVYSVRALPDHIEIEGPQSQLNSVDKLLTETVNLTGRDRNFSTRVEVETPQDLLRVVTKGQIELLIEISEERVTRKLENISLQLPAAAPNFRLLTTAVSVELYGPRSVIEQLNQSELRAELSAEKLSAGAERAPVRLRLPPDADPRIKINAVTPAEARLKPAR